jgi:hypothetical protein
MLTFFIISKLENYHLSKISIHFSALVILMLISGTRGPEYETEEKHFMSFPRRKRISLRKITSLYYLGQEGLTKYN